MKKNVFITGSTRGIGKAIALEFARNGYDVILHGSKKTDNNKDLLRQIKKISKNSSIHYFDVTSKEQVCRGCEKIIDIYKTIDVLINNAGITRDRTFMKMADDEWDAVIKTNLYGPYYVTKQILPLMIGNNFGRIINISSVVALSGNFGQTNYAASKAALLGMAKSLSKELARYNITVNSICPGFTDTDMVANIPKEILETKVLAKIPKGRLARPDEIAYVALFLASEKSAYITGEFININGGLL